jgi:multidrug resistance efflux pump
MMIVAVLYAVLVWLVFFKLKWLRWGWGTGAVTLTLGMLLCAVFVGFLSYLAPTGRVTVISRVVEVTPNVSGEIIEIPVSPNRLVKAGAVLFRIDPTPYEAQVRTIDAQLKFQELRLSQMQQLQASSSGRAFDVEQRQAEVDQLRGQRDKAQYDLDQTTINAPADGYVGTLTLNKGDRATPSKSVMSFILADATRLVGIFSQNGFQTIKPGARVQFALSNNPGHLYSSTIEEIAAGVGEGQIASSGTLDARHIAADDGGLSGRNRAAQGYRASRPAARHVGHGDRLCPKFIAAGYDRLASALRQGADVISLRPECE